MKDFDHLQERITEAACLEIDQFISDGNNFTKYNLYVTIHYCPEEHKFRAKFHFVKQNSWLKNWWYSRKADTIKL